MKILFATDDSKFSDAAAMNLAAQFRPQDTEVLVMHVVEPVAVAAVPQMSSGYYPELEDRIPQAKQLVEHTASLLTAAGFATTTFVTEGDAKSELLDKADQWSADLIVLGSHGHKGLERFLLGSVSAAVARHAHCSVEIIRNRN